MTRVLADFLGSYTVSRVITDVRAGAQSRFEGQAALMTVGPETEGEAIYRETGELIMESGRFAAERSYHWRTAGPLIEVLFSDGRAFHSFDPNAGGLASAHLCGEDWYRGGYDLSAWPEWSVTWDVDGPRKDYKSVTTFQRL